MSLRRARRRDLRLLPVALVCWAWAAAAISLPALALWLGIGGATASGLLLLLAARGHRGVVRTFAATCAVAAAFGAVAALHVAFAQPARDAVAALPVDGGRSLTVEAVVVGKVERTATGWRFDAVAEHIAIGADRHPAQVPIVVRTTVVPPHLDLGATVTITGTAFRTDAGQRAVLVVRAGGEPVVRAPPRGVLATASHLRHGLQRAVAGLPPPAAGLIAGLSVGDTSAVSTELDAQMKASSLSHLTAVSGANCALVVGIAFAGAALLGAGRTIRVAAGVIALIGFVLLVSPEPSVVRAATMAVVAMTGLLLGRVGAGVSVLCVAIVVVLAADPWLALSMGFALSAAATGSLLLAAGPIADGLSRWMPAPLALALAVPLAAQLACGPLLVLITPTVPLYGVLANLVAGPAAPAGTVVGLLACLAGGVPVLAQGFAALAWLPAAWVAECARVAASLPGSAVPWLSGPPGLVAMTVTGTAVLLVILPHPQVPTRVRAIAALTLAAVAGTVLAAGPLAAIVERARTPHEWSIVACDAGQGDAVLIRSAGRVALIDTGPVPQALDACLTRFGVARLDLLVLTHFDLDHRGGVDAVRGRVGVVLHGPVDDPEAAAVVDGLAAGGAELARARTGMSGRLGESDWRVLWPGSGAYRGNDASVVIEITGGGLPSIVLLGDLSAGPQAALAPSLGAGYDVVKVAHHGSADQHAPLYERIAARVALVTVGENTYGHPRTEILDLLRDAGTRVLRTDQSGAVAVWSAGDRLRIWQEHAVDGAR